jgi:hypothetical protein
VKIIFGYRVQDEGYWLDALFPRVIGMKDISRGIPWSREVYNGDLEEIQYGGLYTNGYTYGYQH